jgi:hypothetical protein
VKILEVIFGAILAVAALNVFVNGKNTANVISAGGDSTSKVVTALTSSQ